MNEIILSVVFIALAIAAYSIWHMQGVVKEINNFHEWISHKVHVTNQRIAELESILAKANRTIAILDGRVSGKPKSDEVVKKTVKVPRNPRKVKS
jgi:hypothetical protein